MNAPVVFHRSAGLHDLYAYATCAALSGSAALYVTARPTDKRVTLAASDLVCASTMSFTPEQARAVAAELLACADALEQKNQGGVA